MPVFNRESRVQVFPFSRQPDGEEVIIGRPETGVFLAVPPDAVDVLDELAAGKPIGDVERAYEATHGETLDLTDFVELLHAKGLIEPIDGSRETKGAVTPAQRDVGNRRYHFATFPQSVARVLFGTPVLAACLLLSLLALAIVIENPAMAVGPKDLYFPDHSTLSILLLTAITYFTLFVHEFAHLVAARAVGVNSRLGIGHRLWVLVAETDLTGLWSVPKKRRYLPLFAGMIVDCVSCSVLIELLFVFTYYRVNTYPLGLRIARAVVFTYLMRIAWQFLLFLRTDIYYVLVNYLGCRNLMNDTETHLKNWAARVIPGVKYRDQSGIPAAEARVIRIYSLLWLAGRAAALALLFFVTIPVCALYIRKFVATFHAGFSANPFAFLDCLLLTSYILVPLLIGMTLWINGLIKREELA
jgi:putative peptide zinc metalloprotease protein